jgi:ribosomal protein S18 acetylase RimI-like enzyme
MDYRLQPVSPADDAAQLAVYASTREDELALTAWSPEQRSAFVAMQHRAQQKHYWQHFPTSLCQLIRVDGVVAGRLWVDPRPDALHILDIAVLPAFRARGLGSRCLRDLQRQAAARGVPLSIQVEVHNPARRLYERLGFVPHGAATGVHQPMAWRAPAPHTVAEEALP